MLEQTAAQLGKALEEITWHGPRHRVSTWQEQASRAQHQLDHYLLPRLRGLAGPLVVVIGGSTGAGKSTLINSIAGQELVSASVLRPTTTHSTALVHPEDAAAFRDQGLLAGLILSNDGAATGGISLHEVAAIPQGLVVIDTPDIDSIASEHHHRAQELLDIADQWLFVTTAARYADARWWEVLDQALAQQSSVAIVVNRIPPGMGEQVKQHLAQMLAERSGLQIPIFLITEQALTAGMITSYEAGEVATWLQGLVATEESRRKVVAQTIQGVAVSVGKNCLHLGDDVGSYNQQSQAYRSQLATIFTSQTFISAIGQGTIIRDEVLSQWTQSLGTTQWMHRLQRTVGQVRDRITNKPQANTSQVQRQVQSYLAQIFLDVSADQLAEALSLAQGHPAVAGTEIPPPLRMLPHQFDARVEEELSAWHRYLVELVVSGGASKRRSAQVAAGGVNAAAVALMLAAFATTGGLVGAEIAIAGGSAVVGQKLLEAIFGEGKVRQLAADALADLTVRADRLLAELQQPFEALAPSVDLGQMPKLAAALMAEAN